MPSIDVAMARSLRGGFWDTVRNSVARSVAADLARRDIINDAKGKVNDIATALSSWDNCMSVAWCKWPVIGIIILVSLIVFSIIWCIIRCCCCGLSCCCSSFQCLKCCGNCCGCCDPPGGNNKHKHLDDPYTPAPHHGYRAEAPMNAPAPNAPGPFSHFSPTTNHAASTPQYAEFDTQKKGNEDSLPAMPSWEGAESKKVMLREEEVEMDNLKKSSVSDQQVGVMNVPSSGRISPMSPGRNPYGPPQGNQNSYLGNQSPDQQHVGVMSSIPSGRLSPMSPGFSPYGQPQANQSSYLGNQPPDHYSPIDQGYGYNSSSSAAAVAADPYGYKSNSSAAADPYGYNSTSNTGAGGYNSPSNTGVIGYNSTSNTGNNGYNSTSNTDVIGYNSTSNTGASGYNSNSNTGAGGYGYGSNSNDGYGNNQNYPVEVDATPAIGAGRLTPARDTRQNNEPQTFFSELPGDEPPSRTQSPLVEAPSNNNYRNATPGPQYGTDPHMRQTPGPRHTATPHQDPYGYSQSPRRTPGPPNDFAYGQARQSPAPQLDYGYNRAFSPAPDRQYGVASPRPLAKPTPQRYYGDEPQSPITNNSGFDFNSGHSRPGQSPTQDSYPGYKAYQPS